MNKTLLIYLIVGGSALGAGGAAGVIVKRVTGSEQVVYKGFDINNYIMDSAALVEEFDNYHGSSPQSQFSVAELINISLEKYRQCENSWSQGIGLADTIVKQTIRNAQVKNGQKFYEESISFSDMVSVANKVYQDGHDGEIDLYAGSNVSTENATYGGTPKHFDRESYKKAYGKTLDEMFIYLICNETVTSGEVKAQDNGYIITCELDVDIATYMYKYQMKTLSNLDGLPTFSYVKLAYTVTKDMMLKTCEVDEKFEARMGVPATIRNTIKYTYHPNEYLKIPEINEKFEYTK